jgi:beta-alanine--pyruvate transaminase
MRDLPQEHPRTFEEAAASAGTSSIQVSESLNLRPYWLPFTANRAFKQAPRLVVAAEGFHYRTADGRRVLDSLSGLWTSGLGHCHPRLVEAVRRQVATLDYVCAFQVSHPGAFALAERVLDLAPERFTHCFFTGSGSESVDTALKIALAWHRLRGDTARTVLVSRERGYHGVNFGGTSVGGIPWNREPFSGALLPGVVHLPHTHHPEHNGFTRGLPAWGAHLADALEDVVAAQGADRIAAVIVEPVSGSAGVLVPPQGYLERLREICTRHGILLVFDEVITGFGRVGAAFACERFGVVPDIITLAKGITNGVVPLGAVLVSREIHEAFMQGPEHDIELCHGYTYSGHPLATAAGLAAMDVYEEEGIFAQAREHEGLFENAIHSLRDARHVVDIRNFGLMGAIELAPREGAPGARGLEVHRKCFEAGVLVRNGTDTLQFAPFFTAGQDYYDQVFSTVREVLSRVD